MSPYLRTFQKENNRYAIFCLSGKKKVFLHPPISSSPAAVSWALWSAYYLKKRAPSLTITIIERGIVPTGASTRNAGFACFGSVTELIADTQKMGEERMLQLVEMRCKGLKRIRKDLRR